MAAHLHQIQQGGEVIGIMIDDKDGHAAPFRAAGRECRAGPVCKAGWGRVIVTSVPAPGAVVRLIWPPNSCMTAWEMSRPRPSPSPFILVEKNGSVTRGKSLIRCYTNRRSR